jgi:hypothetical protein
MNVIGVVKKKRKNKGRKKEIRSNTAMHSIKCVVVGIEGTGKV